jgi:hypothetical protein
MMNMSVRKEYQLSVEINGRKLTRVVIDQHYKENHAESITDELILDLVKEIDGEVFTVDSVRGDFQYFVAEPVFNEMRPYRLVMVLCIHDDYLGVINAFRVNRKD